MRHVVFYTILAWIVNGKTLGALAGALQREAELYVPAAGGDDWAMRIKGRTSYQNNCLFLLVIKVNKTQTTHLIQRKVYISIHFLLQPQKGFHVGHGPPT